MTSQRIQHGRCSFIPPRGYAIEKRASLPETSSSGCCQCCAALREPVSITLINATARPDVPAFSKKPEDMFPDACPVSITILTLAQSARPWDYLNETSNVLRECLSDFTVHFFKKDRIGADEAARSQVSFRQARVNSFSRVPAIFFPPAFLPCVPRPFVP